MKFIDHPAEVRDATFSKVLALPLEVRADVLSRIYGRFELTEAFDDVKKIVDEVSGAYNA